MAQGHCMTAATRDGRGDQKRMEEKRHIRLQHRVATPVVFIEYQCVAGR
jgi:hypothetical protein